MTCSVSPATATTILNTEQGSWAVERPRYGLSTVRTRPVWGSMATTAPGQLPSPWRAPALTATSRAEAAAGTTSAAGPGGLGAARRPAVRALDVLELRLFRDAAPATWGTRQKAIRRAGQRVQRLMGRV